MKVLCLGGAGRICRETAFDLVEFSDFERITIADNNIQAAEATAAWLDDPRVDSACVNVYDLEKSVETLKEYDIVVDGTTISLNGQSTECIAKAGCHGINLNGFGDEYPFGPLFAEQGKVFVPGFGMTPGTTNMMAKHACDKMATIDTVRISHGAYRPVAFSAAIMETTSYEYDPDLPGRVVYEKGEFIQVPPFARPRDIALPEPYGTNPQYIIPHAETVTLAEYLADKGVNLIEVRGTWPPENMQLIRTLYDWGVLKNETVTVDGHEFGIMKAIAAFLQQSPKGKSTQLYGYALHVEVTGWDDKGRRIEAVLYHTHPSSDGSIPGWEGLRAYTRNVGIPISIAAQLIAQNRFTGTGALIPEKVFNPADIFSELARREIYIHETTKYSVDESTESDA